MHTLYKSVSLFREQGPAWSMPATTRIDNRGVGVRFRNTV